MTPSVILTGLVVVNELIATLSGLSREARAWVAIVKRRKPKK